MSGARTWAAVAAIYLVGTLVFAWPLPMYLHTHVWGDRFDAWTTLWLIGHLADGLREGTLSAETQAVLYPIGYNLWSFGHAALQAIGAGLVAVGVPLVLSYNLLFLLAFWTSALGAHLFGTELSGRHLGGWVAGTVFATSPYLYGEGAAGCIELVAAGLLPLFAWALLRLARAPGRRRLVVAVACLAIIGPFNWYYTLFAGMYGLGFAAWMWLASERRAALWVLAALVLAGAVDAPLIPIVRRETPPRPEIPAALFTDPDTWAASNKLADGETALDSLTEAQLEQHDALQVMRNSTDLRSLLLARFTVNPLKSTPGALAYVVGLAALVALRGRGLGFFVIGAGATVLTVGPFLMVDDTPPLPDWSANLPLPYWFAYTYLPFFSKAYRPYRIGVITLLCCAALGAAAIANAAPSSGSRGRDRLAKAMVILLFGVGYTQPVWSGDQPALRPLSDARPPAIYQELRAAPPGAVIEVPLQYQPLTVGNARFHYYQLAHGHPLLNNNQLIRRPDLLAFREYVGQNSVLQVLMDLARRPAPLEFKAEDVAKLYDEGFRYVVVHPTVPEDAVHLAGAMGDADLVGQPAMDMLRGVFGAPKLADEETWVFELPEALPPGTPTRWDESRVVEVPLTLDRRRFGLPVVLHPGDRLPVWKGEPAARSLSFWARPVSGGEGLVVELSPEVVPVTLVPGSWRWIEVSKPGAPEFALGNHGDTPVEFEITRLQVVLR